MKTQVIVSSTGKRATLTTDHASSSYGQPVLVLGHQAYGPGDGLGEVRTAKLDTSMAETDLVLRWNASTATAESNRNRVQRPGYIIDLSQIF